MNTDTVRHLRNFLGALLLLAALAPSAEAQTLTYQGRLKESGVPVNGNRNVDILFCNCLSGVCAPACASSGVQGVAVSSGLFRSTFTLPGSVDLGDSQSWYLEVQVNGTPLLPREGLTVVPYAVVAATAAGLIAFEGEAGVTIATRAFFTNGSVGIGTTLPAAKLHVSTGAIIVDGPGAVLKVPEVSASNTPGASLTVRATDNSGGGGGGGLTLQAGSGTSGDSPGGPLSLAAGDSSGTGAGGSVNINAGSQGAGTGGGGAVTVSAGSGANVNGGAVTISAGASTNQSGGAVTITAGAGPVVDGGDVILVAGNGMANGGAVFLRPGQRGGGGGEHGVVIIDGATAGGAHLRATQPAAPTVADNTFCGTVAGVAIGTDMAGRINFPITAGTPTAACMITVTFSRQYASPPRTVLITPANAISAAVGGAAIGAYVDNVMMAGASFSVRVNNAPGVATYSWYYMVIE